jgi:ParB family transcriptional regulator, chromosome partitioning protein
VKDKALGKGFQTLLGMDKEQGSGVDASRVIEVSVNDISPNPHQPRKFFNDEELESLKNSIEVDGVIQPIIVSRKEGGGYTLIAGERRWRATKLLGKTTIPAIVKNHEPDAMLRIALIENIQRADLNIIEEAEAYGSLINDFGLSQEQCAAKVGKDRTTVTNALRMLTLPNEIKDDLVEKRLSPGHARSLLSLEDKASILKARDVVVKKKMNVRQTEMLCKRLKSKPAASAQEQVCDADLDHIAEALRAHLRTKVKIAGNSKKGKIEVSYFSAAELERISSLLGVELG